MSLPSHSPRLLACLTAGLFSVALALVCSFCPAAGWLRSAWGSEAHLRELAGHLGWLQNAGLDCQATAPYHNHTPPYRSHHPRNTDFAPSMVTFARLAAALL